METGKPIVGFYNPVDGILHPISGGSGTAYDDTELRNLISSLQETVNGDISALLVVVEGKAPASHSHTTADISGIIPEWRLFSGNNPIDLDGDGLDPDTMPMKRFIIENGTDTAVPCSSLFMSGEGKIIHDNKNIEVEVEASALLTIYCLTIEDHAHQFVTCYYVTVDAVYNT